MKFQEGKEERWQRIVAANSDTPEVFEFAQSLAKALEARNPTATDPRFASDDDFAIENNFPEVLKEVESNYPGLSGAVRGFTIHKLVECWLWGERLRRRYNEYVGSPDTAMLANRRPGCVLCF